MSEEFTVSAFIPALPLAVYLAWLDGTKHSEMTGAEAHCEPAPGAPFDAWDGYIRGTNVELEPGRRIVQRWRTAEFPGDAPDSRVEITLAPEGNGTRLTLQHSNIPQGQGHLYQEGWQDHYFRPMQEYFVHAGIGGVAHGARVTEVIRKVQIGEAAPLASPGDQAQAEPAMSEAAPSSHGVSAVTPPEVGAGEPVETTPEPEPEPTPESAPAPPADVPSEPEPAAVTSSSFDLADEDEDDQFETGKAEETTAGEDFWKHLEEPPKTEPVKKEEPKPAAAKPAGRKPARRTMPAGAGRPARRTKPKTGLKRAAKPGAKKAKPATKKKPAKSAKPAKKKAATRKKPAAKKKAAPKKKAATRKKPAAKKKPAPKKKAATRKKPAAKKKAAKKKPAPKRRRK